MSETEKEQVVMPCPRLEFEWFDEGEDHPDEKLCIYSIVLPLRDRDVRREDENGNKVRRETKAELGRTSRRGGRLISDEGKVDTPFRDGAHAKWDRDALGGHLPIVAVYGNTFSVIEDEA